MHGPDDRGRRVRMLPRRHLSFTPGMPSPIPMDNRRLMYTERQRLPFSKEVLIATIVGCVVTIAWCFVCFRVFSYLFNTVRVSDAFNYVVMPTIFLPPMPVMYWLGARAIRQKTAAIIARHGFCASCGYRLRDIPVADDGCTVCPECGSAWRVGQGERQ